MIGRSRTAAAFLLAGVVAGCSTGPDAPDARPGEPLHGLTDAELGRFLLGRAVFERIATPEEGLGPLFNADRCSACHDSPAPGGTAALLVVKATAFDGEQCDLLEAEGGDNLQQRVTPALAALGVGAESPPVAPAISVRITAPPLFGLGLLEAVPDAELLRLADPDDADGDGISGRAPLLDGRIARFGRKGETVSIEDFVDTALRFELGLTTPANPHEERPSGHELPAGADPMTEPEIEDRGVGLLADFARYLAPPARLIVSGEARDSIATGEEIFGDIGCTACHVPELRTGDAASPALAKRTVPAWSDLLLHDMGDALASVCGARATPSEWRTAPLWGLRLRDRLLHDGRATDPAQAIDAHGGEAAASRDAWRALPADARARLLAFLLSL